MECSLLGGGGGGEGVAERPHFSLPSFSRKKFQPVVVVIQIGIRSNQRRTAKQFLGTTYGNKFTRHVC